MGRIDVALTHYFSAHRSDISCVITGKNVKVSRLEIWVANFVDHHDWSIDQVSDNGDKFLQTCQCIYWGWGLFFWNFLENPETVYL
jgi:hypothetical protein